MKQHTTYSIARFDGALMYNSLRAGFLPTGITKSPVVFFKIRAGVQLHPVWALDELAMEIYAYCETAKTANVSDTHLQASMVASWVSGESFSNLIATTVEWHIASRKLRDNAQFLHSQLMKDMELWPDALIKIPVTEL